MDWLLTTAPGLVLLPEKGVGQGHVLRSGSCPALGGVGGVVWHVFGAAVAYHVYLSHVGDDWRAGEAVWGARGRVRKRGGGAIGAQQTQIWRGRVVFLDGSAPLCDDECDGGDGFETSDCRSGHGVLVDATLWGGRWGVSQSWRYRSVGT